MIKHSIPAVYNQKSKILILGSFPSVKSRDTEFFYGHPQNRFWKILMHLFDVKELSTNEEKRNFLLKHKIALWDVIEVCDITNSDDSTIRNVKVNDLTKILSIANIEKIYINGNKAGQLYKKYIAPQVKIEYEILPSTSSANARCSFESLIEKWSVILKQ